MNLLDELDERMETVDEIANHLEAQMGRYERGRSLPAPERAET